MKKQLEIDYAFGYVYDKSKLIVMYPAGTNVIDLDDYEMEVEVAFLEDGIDAAFEENDVKEANETIKPLETFLMKPSKVIPFVTSIKNAETKEELHKLLAEFDEEYEVKENYIKNWVEGDIVGIYDFDEFTKAGGYIRLLNPELGDDVCIIEDSDFLDTDKTFADIFPNMEHLKLYYIDNLAYSIDEITEGLIIKQSKV